MSMPSNHSLILQKAPSGLLASLIAFVNEQRFASVVSTAAGIVGAYGVVWTC